MCRKVHEGARPEDMPANFILLSLIDPDVQDGQHEKNDPQDEPHKKEGSLDSELPEKPKPKPGAKGEKKTGMSTATKAIIGAAVGGASCVVAAPLVLTAVGFTSAGIAGGSLAASMMSSAAIANGGGIAAGSAVAVLQSFGAAGIPAAVSAGIGAGGAAVGGGLTTFANFLRGKLNNDKPKEGKDK